MLPLRNTKLTMRRTSLLLVTFAALSLLATGCAGPEKKFGRGLANIAEPLRMGEFRRTMEQTAISDGPDVAYTRGFIRGINKTIVRTAVGVYEVATFPIPDHGVGNYEPLLYPENPVYPDNYKPRILDDPLFQADSVLGFGTGDVAPWFSGSRFRVFD